MKTTLIIVVVVVTGLLWIRSVKYTDSTTPMAVGYNTNHLRTAPASASHRYEDLQLYPIYASGEFIQFHRVLGPYLTLKEALDQNKIEITELEAPGNVVSRQRASVNNLFVENLSADTIIILGGEVIRGGKQDRMIAKDFMIHPHSGKINVNVFCVEHGRWATEDETMLFDIAMDIAPSKVRKAASAGDGAQEKVWEEVADINEGMAEDIRTGALSHAMLDVKIQQSNLPYKEHLERIEWSDAVVGVVAVFNDEIIGCDIFAQPALFRKYYTSLLSSYYPYGELDNNQTRSQPDVNAFLNKLLADEPTLEKHLEKQGTQLKQGKFRIHLSAF